MAGPVRTAVCVLGAVSLFAGCGHGGEKTTTTAAVSTAAAPAGKVVDGIHVLAVVPIRETEYRLEPSRVGFQVRGYFGIKAVNDGTVAHALAISGHGVNARTQTIAPGESDTIAVYFSKPGIYGMFCPIDGHARLGMRGVVRVR